MPIEFSVGHASHTGKREHNEDVFGIVTPEEADLAARGALLAVADGVSGGGDGRTAAESTVRGLLSDYYATPETWGIPLALDRVLSAINRWLVAQGTAHRQRLGMATTLSLLVLRGNRYYVGHVGDSRIYRLRQKQLMQLTEDHVWDGADMQHVLKRAVGLDQHLMVDYADDELMAGDRFLLCSDGVWEPLGELRILEMLGLYDSPQLAANALVEAALRAGGTDNATAVVARIDSVPGEGWRDMLGAAPRLPVPPRLKPGQFIDDFEVLRVVHESRATLLYQVRSLSSKQVLALKTLQPILADDRTSCEGLLAEEWLAKRLVMPCFPQVVPLSSASAGAGSGGASASGIAAGHATGSTAGTPTRNYLYYVMTYHAGATLQQQLDSGKHFPASEVVAIGVQVVRGLSALQRLSILHRDIKPANLLQTEDGGLRILDMGVALAAGVPYPELQAGSHVNPGTPSFMAPELFQGEAASAQSDIYAAGVTLYHLLTRKYPYGEVEPFQQMRFGDAVPATRYRPDVPQWLDNLLLRAVARDRKQRFETPEEMLLALERGAARPVSAPQRLPLLQRRLDARWPAIALVSIVINLLLLYLLLLR